MAFGDLSGRTSADAAREATRLAPPRTRLGGGACDAVGAETVQVPPSAGVPRNCGTSRLPCEGVRRQTCSTEPPLTTSATTGGVKAKGTCGGRNGAGGHNDGSGGGAAGAAAPCGVPCEVAGKETATSGTYTGTSSLT